MRRFATVFAGSFLASLAALFAPGASAAPMRLDVDASDIERRIVHSTMKLEAAPGKLELFYVLWTPGNHNPSGPIQNVVNVFFEDGRGGRLEWDRHSTDPTRFIVHVPDGVREVTAKLSYITDQPGVNSRSTDTYGQLDHGGMNWNTVLLYPVGADKDEFMIEASLRLPEGWRQASSLPVEREQGERVEYGVVSLARLVDSPVVFGSTLRSYEIPAPGMAPHFVHVVAPTDEQAEVPEATLEVFAEMLVETEKIFGPMPYDQYHFLVVASDVIPGFGVEHTRSTYIGTGADAFSGPVSRLGVFPHEYVHTWNGKMRAHEGLHGRDYNHGMKTELLWVYEGMTSYYDEVIAVRSGMTNFEGFERGMMRSISGHSTNEGRKWRSVEDTARALRHLRAGSASWSDLRRRQDYYGEGALFWATVDAVIRRGTGGERSLDDFTRAFFAVTPGPVGSPIEYARDDLVAGLTEVYSGQDWSTLIREMIEEPHEDLSFVLPALLGYNFEVSSEPGEAQDERGSLTLSLGFEVRGDGEISTVRAGTLADEAKLAEGMTILGVGGAGFTRERLVEAVKASPKTGRIDLLLRWGDRLVEKAINYREGLRYTVFEPIEGETNVLEAIATGG